MTRTITPLLLTVFLVGCVTQTTSDITYQLRPSWIAVLFGKNATLADYVQKSERDWLCAAAYYVSEKHSPLSSNAELTAFLAEKLPGGVAIPAPTLVAPHTFAVGLKSGSTVMVIVTSDTLDMKSADRSFTNALMSQVTGHESKDPSGASSDFAVTHALSGVFK